MLRNYCGATACHNSTCIQMGWDFCERLQRSYSLRWFDSKLFLSQVFRRQWYFFNADALGHLEEIQ